MTTLRSSAQMVFAQKIKECLEAGRLRTSERTSEQKDGISGKKTVPSASSSGTHRLPIGSSGTVPNTDLKAAIRYFLKLGVQRRHLLRKILGQGDGGKGDGNHTAPNSELDNFIAYVRERKAEEGRRDGGLEWTRVQAMLVRTF